MLRIDRARVDRVRVRSEEVQDAAKFVYLGAKSLETEMGAEQRTLRISTKSKLIKDVIL